jgi:dihydrofolate reductase
VLYLSGTSYRQTSATTVPWYPSSSRAYYNQISAGSGSLVAAASDGLYMCYWAILTNDSSYPVKLVMGRNTYATMQEAESEVFVDYGLPMPEIVPMYKFILQTSSTFTQNTARVNIVSVKELVGRQNDRNNTFRNLSHDSLVDKNSADQHTISSITGLQSQLDTASGSAVAMAIALG